MLTSHIAMLMFIVYIFNFTYIISRSFLNFVTQFHYKGSISRGSSIKRFIERVAKQRAINPNGFLR